MVSCSTRLAHLAHRLINQSTLRSAPSTTILVSSIAQLVYAQAANEKDDLVSLTVGHLGSPRPGVVLTSLHATSYCRMRLQSGHAQYQAPNDTLSCPATPEMVSSAPCGVRLGGAQPPRLAAQLSSPQSPSLPLHSGLASPCANWLAETSEDCGAAGLAPVSEGPGEFRDRSEWWSCWWIEGGVGSGRASSDMAPQQFTTS